MAIINSKFRNKNIDNTGFSNNSSNEGRRLINADGSANIKKRGLPVWSRISIYHTLLRMKRTQFFLSIFLFYTGINLFFAVIYFSIGVENLMGVDKGQSYFDKFMEAFFFSSQTLTTVGYGRVSPMGMLTNTFASLESLLGITVFAVMTGLIYGRFSRPRAYLKFSDNLIVAPYKDGIALMFRIATYKNNHLTDVEAQVTLALHIKENEKKVTKFFQLNLEISKINSLSLSWTLVHPINEDSPLINYTKEDIKDSEMEVIVNVKGFDDHFSNIVQQRTSYTYSQVVYGAKFKPMYERATDGSTTILELNKINDFELVKMPVKHENSELVME